MKERLKKMFEESLHLILKNAPLKQRIPSMLNILVKSIMRNYMKVTLMMMRNTNNKKRTLQVISYNIWIDHFNHKNTENSADIQAKQVKQCVENFGSISPMRVLVMKKNIILSSQKVTNNINLVSGEVTARSGATIPITTLKCVSISFPVISFFYFQKNQWNEQIWNSISKMTTLQLLDNLSTL